MAAPPVCVWAPDRQTITLTFPVWQIVFSKMTTADSSTTYASRILPSCNKEVKAVSAPLDVVSVARIWWERCDVASSAGLKRAVHIYLALSLGMLALERSCYVVRKLRPHEEAMWTCPGGQLQLWPQATHMSQMVPTCCLHAAPS